MVEQLELEHSRSVVPAAALAPSLPSGPLPELRSPAGLVFRWLRHLIRSDARRSPLPLPAFRAGGRQRRIVPNWPGKFPGGASAGSLPGTVDVSGKDEPVPGRNPGHYCAASHLGHRLVRGICPAASPRAQGAGGDFLRGRRIAPRIGGYGRSPQASAGLAERWTHHPG